MCWQATKSNSNSLYILVCVHLVVYPDQQHGGKFYLTDTGFLLNSLQFCIYMVYVPVSVSVLSHCEGITVLKLYISYKCILKLAYKIMFPWAFPKHPQCYLSCFLSSYYSLIPSQLRIPSSPSILFLNPLFLTSLELFLLPQWSFSPFQVYVGTPSYTET